MPMASIGSNPPLRPSFPDLEPAKQPFTKVYDGVLYDVACRAYIDTHLNCERAYIIASKSLAAQTDRLQRLEKTLGEKHVGSWVGIPPHTPFEALIDIINDARDKNADCIITLGGGSIADGAQIISYAIANNVQTYEDLTNFGKKFRVMKLVGNIGTPAEEIIDNAPMLPLILCPTTLSGAEYSRFAGATDPVDHLKVFFTHPKLFPSLIVLDLELTLTTPDWVWRSTGVRAIDQCIENIASGNANSESDVASERGLVRLVRSLLAYQKNPKDVNARLESMMGCNDSLIGLTVGVMAGASHGIGHQLGPLGVAHGHTSGILSPAVEKYNSVVKKAQQDKIQRLLWNESDIATVLENYGLKRDRCDVGDCLRAIFTELGMPKTLKEVGVTRDQWESLAINSLKDPLVQTNPRPLRTKEDIYEILEMVAGDQ